MVDTAAAWRGQARHPGQRRHGPREAWTARTSRTCWIEVFRLRLIFVNLRGTYLMSRFAVPHMRRSAGAGSSTSRRRPGRSRRPCPPRTPRPRRASSDSPGRCPRTWPRGGSRSTRSLLGHGGGVARDAVPRPGHVNVDAEIKRRGVEARGRPVRVPGGHRGRGRLPRLGRRGLHDRPDPGAGRRRVRVDVREEGRRGRPSPRPATAAARSRMSEFPPRGDRRHQLMTVCPRIKDAGRGLTMAPEGHAAVPCRSRRQSAAPAGVARRAGGPGGGAHHRRGAARGRGRGDQDAVALQQLVGLQSATDGEFRRATWHMDFVYQIGGISKAQGSLLSTFHNEGGDITFTPDAIRVDRRVTMDTTIFGDDFAFLQSIAGDSVPKLTIPAPSMVHYRSGIRAVVTEDIYPDVESFWSDLGAAYNAEVQRLAAQGCRYLQLDDTSLAYVNDPSQREYIAGARRGRRSASISSSISLTNGGGGRAARRHGASPRTCAAATSSPRGWASEVKATTSWPRRCSTSSTWTASSSNSTMKLVRRLRAAAIRSAWQPSGAGPGHHEAPRARNRGRPQAPHRRSAAKYVPPRPALPGSGQCGISASTAEGNALTLDDEKAKLSLIVDVAQDVWG